MSGSATATPSAAKPATDINEIFAKMSYGPAPESQAAVNKWLQDHGRKFGLFIGNQWVHPEGRSYMKSVAPATLEVLAETMQATREDVDVTVVAARTAFNTWSTTPGSTRARILYSIARHLQKHFKLLSVLEALDNGKPFVESMNADVKLLVRHFYYYAGWAQLCETEMAEYAPLGVIAQVIPWNFPLMMLAWKIAPALAMGNTVILKPASATRLSALLFAEIVAEAGVPPGVINILTGPGSIGGYLCAHPDVDKVAFTGSTEIGQGLRKSISGSGKKISLELGGKSPVLVFDSADLDAAVEGVIQAIFFNQGQVCCAGSRLLVQESVYTKFIEMLKFRLGKHRVTVSLDKCTDMGAIVDAEQLRTVQSYIDIAREEGCTVWQPEIVVPTSGYFLPPTIITNVQPVSRCVQEEIFGPVLCCMSFRVPSEAYALANNTKFGLASSVWSENINLALEAAHAIKSGVVWVNSHNIFDAAAGFGGYGESGFGREGGKEGLFEYVRPSWQKRPRPDISKIRDVREWSAATPALPPAPTSSPIASTSTSPASDHVDRTWKIHIGGKQRRSDSNHYYTVKTPKGAILGQVPDCNRKDIRDAVEAANLAQNSWANSAPFLKSQIMYYIAENMQCRREEFASRLSTMTGVSMEEALHEVDLSIDRMFYWASYTDKNGGIVQETPWKGFTIQVNEPVGTIGIVCPNNNPLLSFISLIAPAIARGNTIIVVPSSQFPLCALDMYQIFDTSDLPPGVINIVTGVADHLAKVLVDHQNLRAVWYFGSAEGSYHVEYLAASNMKRTWVSYGQVRDWSDRHQGSGHEFLHHACEVKNIWLPVGETAF
ncbi:aldehyde dehydrogenase [Pelomyxa schiedti]|nr:aldehyde dehydrogenase [Pelomyxa schiedti]